MVALDSQRVTGTAFVWLKMGKMVEGNVDVGTKRTDNLWISYIGYILDYQV